MQRTDFDDVSCSMARALNILGEWWTPLILRDLLVGVTQFDELHRDLGISTNVLTDRLRRLTDYGVVERRPYGSHSNRFEYRLTAKGQDAVPILLLLVAWGDQWEAGPEGPPTHIVHTSCGKPTKAVIHCGECGQRLEPQDLEYHKGPGSRRARGTELLRDYLGPTRPGELAHIARRRGAGGGPNVENDEAAPTPL